MFCIRCQFERFGGAHQKKKRKENGSRVADLKSRRTNPLETQRRRRRRREGALLMPKVFSSSVRASASFFFSGPLCCPPAAVIGNRGGNVFLSFFRLLTLDFPPPRECAPAWRDIRQSLLYLRSEKCPRRTAYGEFKKLWCIFQKEEETKNTLQRWGKGESG